MIGSGATLVAETATVAGAVSNLTGLSVATAETVVATSATALLGAGAVTGAVGAVVVAGAAAYGVCQWVKSDETAQ
jgi:hypothetical protein